MVTELEAVNKTLNDIHSFVVDRFEPSENTIRLLGEEQERLAASVVEAQDMLKEIRRANIDQASQRGGQAPVVQSGKYAGYELADVMLAHRIARSHSGADYGPAWVANTQEAIQGLREQLTPERVDSFQGQNEDLMKRGIPNLRQYRDTFHPEMQGYRAASMRAAMDSTTAGSGDELVSTLESQQLWMDVNLRTIVAANIPTINMPSNPFEMPRQLGDVNWYPGVENVGANSTAPGTGKTTMNAYELVANVPYSFTLEEDAIIAMLSEIRSGLVRNTAEVLEDIILNADTTVTNNINADGATIATTDAGKGQWLLGYDGLIHLPLIDNTGQANDHNAAVSDDMFNEIRAKLGKYGVSPSNLFWVSDIDTFIRCQSISNFRTMDKLGPQATVLTGMLGAVEGIPFLVSEQMLKVASDGKVTDGTAGTVGRLLIVNRDQWRQGFRRSMTIDVTRDTQKRQTVITASLRHALVERSGTRSSATHTALQYNITGL